jgi:hypothetical protein
VTLLLSFAYDIGASSLANIESASKDDRALLNCLENLSYVRVLSWLLLY